MRYSIILYFGIQYRFANLESQQDLFAISTKKTPCSHYGSKTAGTFCLKEGWIAKTGVEVLLPITRLFLINATKPFQQPEWRSQYICLVNLARKYQASLKIIKKCVIFLFLFFEGTFIREKYSACKIVRSLLVITCAQGILLNRNSNNCRHDHSEVKNLDV